MKDPFIHCCPLNPSPFAGRSRTMASPELGLFFFSLAKSAAKCCDLRVLVPIHSFKLTASLPLKNGGWETTGRIDTFREGRKICFPLISSREPFPVFRRNGADGVFFYFNDDSDPPKKSSFPFSPLMVNATWTQTYDQSFRQGWWPKLQDMGFLGKQMLKHSHILGCRVIDR